MKYTKRKKDGRDRGEREGGREGGMVGGRKKRSRGREEAPELLILENLNSKIVSTFSKYASPKSQKKCNCEITSRKNVNNLYVSL